MYAGCVMHVLFRILAIKFIISESIISITTDTLSSVVGAEHAGESNTSPLSVTEEGLSLLYQAGTYQYKLDRSSTTTYAYYGV